MPEKLRIGIFGGAFIWDGHAEALARTIGQEVVRRDCLLVTGATTGLPYHAGKAALATGGFVLGISPAKDATEHVDRYRKPLDGCSVIIWTGAGYTGRNWLNLRNCDGAIFVGGETGTLEEFCVANYEGKVIGVLEGSGGIADKIRDLMAVCPTDHGSIIIYDTDPCRLIETVHASLNR